MKKDKKQRDPIPRLNFCVLPFCPAAERGCASFQTGNAPKLASISSLEGSNSPAGRAKRKSLARYVHNIEEVRLWELDPAEHLARGEIALLPLIPLMGQEPSAEVLKQAVEAAGKVENEAEQADLLTGISVLGSLRHARELIHAMIRREKMKESPIYQEIMQKGKQYAITKFLTERFGPVPEEMVQAIQSVEEAEELDRLIEWAARCQSLEEFSEHLTGAGMAGSSVG